MSSVVSKAIQLAAHWHDGQVDKTRMPYIFHPLRVMEKVNREHIWVPAELYIDHSYPDRFLATAVLHDTLEDTFCPEKEIKLLGHEIYEAVVALSRRKAELELDRVDEYGAKAWGKPLETYKEYLERCCASPIARVVKTYDLLDNLDLDRYHPDCPYDRYLKAYHTITGIDLDTEEYREQLRLLGWLDKRR